MHYVLYINKSIYNHFISISDVSWFCMNQDFKKKTSLIGK